MRFKAFLFFLEKQLNTPSVNVAELKWGSQGGGGGGTTLNPPVPEEEKIPGLLGVNKFNCHIVKHHEPTELSTIQYCYHYFLEILTNVSVLLKSFSGHVHKPVPWILIKHS